MSARWTVHHGEVLEALAKMDDCSYDGGLFDVPYGLGSRQPNVEELIAYLTGAELDTGGDFMGAGWSVPSVRVWRELHRVLKPGAHVLSFAGSRTGDLISLGMRAAGFEVRDTLMWIYVSSMPKSLDVAKAIDKRAGASRATVATRKVAVDKWTAEGRRRLEAGHVAPTYEIPVTAPATEDAQHWDGFGSGIKPCYEPVILARKPLDGTLIDNVRKWGCGALAIDECRIEASTEDVAKARVPQPKLRPDGNDSGHALGSGKGRSGDAFDMSNGRWPPNVLIDEAVAALLDAQSGDRPGMSGGGKHTADYAGGMFGAIDSTATARHDAGGISRMLYVAKASREERERGCEHLPRRSASAIANRKSGSAGLKHGRSGPAPESGARNYGPCVKPVALDRWLATLIKPPPHRDGTPRRLLNCYSGTGSEMIGAILAGWDEVIGVEREPRPGVKDAPDYLAILKARVHLAATNPRAFEPFANRKSEKPDERQTSLFGKASGT
jgi:hypothetical protein